MSTPKTWLCLTCVAEMRAIWNICMIQNQRVGFCLHLRRNCHTDANTHTHMHTHTHGHMHTHTHTHTHTLSPVSAFCILPWPWWGLESNAHDESGCCLKPLFQLEVISVMNNEPDLHSWFDELVFHPDIADWVLNSNQLTTDRSDETKTLTYCWLRP